MNRRDNITENTPEMGRRLKDARHQREMSQAELAVILEVSTSALSRWEDGTRNPKPIHSQLISRWLEQIEQSQ